MPKHDKHVNDVLVQSVNLLKLHLAVGSKLYLLQAWLGMGWEDSYAKTAREFAVCLFAKSQVALLSRFKICHCFWLTCFQ